MVNKKIPERMCIACKECKPKKDLIRIVRTGETFEVDFKGKMNGRGAYICNNDECFEKLINQKLVNKSFKQNISKSVYDYLKEKYFENREN